MAHVMHSTVLEVIFNVDGALSGKSATGTQTDHAVGYDESMANTDRAYQYHHP
jgi:hypothetical protein